MDADDDGYSTGPAVLSCSSPGPGYKNSGIIAFEDCDDNPKTGGRVNKGAQEICNGVDDDCDGLVDNDDPSVVGKTNWYMDADDDGYSTGPAVLSCSSPGPGYKNAGIIAFEDCDDDPKTGGRVNKGAQEVLNGKDDDCDGSVDEETAASGLRILQSYISGLRSNIQKSETEVLLKSFSVKVYPNPTSNYFSLNFNSFSNEKVIISISDVVGRVMLNMEGSANSTYRFGERFPKGSYIVSVLQAGKRSTIKIIKN
jgi:hypothetical protein